MDFDSLSPAVKQMLFSALGLRCAAHNAIDRDKWEAASKLDDEADMQLAAAAELHLNLGNAVVE